MIQKTYEAYLIHVLILVFVNLIFHVPLLFVVVVVKTRLFSLLIIWFLDLVIVVIKIDLVVKAVFVAALILKICFEFLFLLLHMLTYLYSLNMLI